MLRIAVWVLMMIIPMKCFAIKPEDMEPNRWYDLQPVTLNVRDLYCDRTTPGRMVAIKETINTTDYSARVEPVVSFDSGKSWQIRSNGISQESIVEGGWYSKNLFLTYERGKPNLFYICFRDHQVSVYKSHDFGLNWTLTGTLTADVLWGSNVHPEKGYILLATQDDPDPESYAEIYKSTDDGKTWMLPYVVETTGAGFHGFEFSPHDASTVFGFGRVYGQTVVKSQDDGQTWTSISSAIASIKLKGLAFHPELPQTLLAIPTGIPRPFLRTDDGGASWYFFGSDDSWNGQFYANSIIFFPDDPSQVAVINNLECNTLQTSTDAGSTWTTVLEADQIDPEFLIKFTKSPWEDKKVFTNLRGLYTTSDNGRTWQMTGMTESQHPAKRMGWRHPTDPLKLVSLQNHVGGLFSTDGGQSWHQSSGVPGNWYCLYGDLIRSNSDHTRLYIMREPEGMCSSSTARQVMVSDDWGRSWRLIPVLQEGDLEVLKPSLTVSNRAFAIMVLDTTPWTNKLLVTDDACATWSPVSLPVGSYLFSDITDSIHDPNVWLLLGVTIPEEELRVFRSDNNGENWTDIAVPGGLITIAKHGDETHSNSIVINRNQPEIMYVYSGGLWISHDYGLTWQNRLVLDEISTSCYKNQFSYDPDDSDVLYINKTHSYVNMMHRSNDEGRTWSAGTFPEITMALPGGIILDARKMSVMKIETKSPKVILSGYLNTRLMHNQSSVLALSVVALDDDPNDEVERVELLFSGERTGVQLDRYEESSIFSMTYSDVNFPVSGLFLFDFEAMDRFGVSSSSAVRLRVEQ